MIYSLHRTFKNIFVKFRTGNHHFPVEKWVGGVVLQNLKEFVMFVKVTKSIMNSIKCKESKIFSDIQNISWLFHAGFRYF